MTRTDAGDLAEEDELKRFGLTLVEVESGQSIESFYLEFRPGQEGLARFLGSTAVATPAVLNDEPVGPATSCGPSVTGRPYALDHTRLLIGVEDRLDAVLLRQRREPLAHNPGGGAVRLRGGEQPAAQGEHEDAPRSQSAWPSPVPWNLERFGGWCKRSRR